MVLSTRSMVPKVYSNSRDYQVLLKLLEIIVTTAKTYTDAFTSLIDPDTCPDHMLPLLANYVGYKYDSSESFNANRVIIKYYPYLIRNRGSITGLKLASALSSRVAEQSNATIDPLGNFNVFVTTEDDGSSYITVSVYDAAALTKIRDLIEVVRPAGVGIKLVLAKPANNVEQIEISDYTDAKKYVSKVGFVGTGEYVALADITDEYQNQVPYSYDSNGKLMDEFSDPDILDRKYSAIVGISEVNELPKEEETNGN